MKAVAILLAFTTLALAASTAYLAHAVKLERGRNASSPSIVAATSDLPAADPRPASASATPLSGNETPAVSAPLVGPVAQLTDVQRTGLRTRLEALRDPATRAARAAKMLVSQRGLTELAEAAAFAGLSPYELERLHSLSVEQALDGEQRQLECQLTDGCDLRATGAEMEKAMRQALAQLLGAEKTQRLEVFNAASTERFRIQQFSRRLPATLAMTDATASRLAVAMAEETLQFAASAARSGEEVREHQQGIFRIFSAERRGAAPDSARTIQSATAYKQNVERRAADILTPAQLTEFTKQQDEALAAFSYTLRDREAAEAIRKAAIKAAAP